MIPEQQALGIDGNKKKLLFNRKKPEEAAINSCIALDLGKK